MLVFCLIQAGGSGGLGPIVPMILMLVLGYFLLIRPVSKQRKEQEEMRSALKPGDQVLTTGGIYGTVAKLRDDRIHLQIADGVQVEVARNHISAPVAPKASE